MKPTVCRHCGSINTHYSFQCPTIRKPIARVSKNNNIVSNLKVGDTFETKEGPCRIVEIEKTPIAPISKQQKKRLAEYRIIRDQFMKEHPMCQAFLSGCTGRSGDLHHKAGKIGKLLTDVRYFMAVCRSCHNWIGQNHSEALKYGFVTTRTDK